MTATYHGHWALYSPDVLPENAPAKAIFWRRADDSADWYEWSRSHWQIAGGTDASGTVKVAVIDGKVSCVSTDATGLTLGSEFDLYELGADDAVPAPGWYAVDGVFSAAPSEPAPFAQLTARQLRLGLLKIGIKPADVAAAIAALPADQRDAAEIEWDYASEYRRDHPLIATLGDSFGLSVEQIDAAWRDAMVL